MSASANKELASQVFLDLERFEKARRHVLLPARHASRGPRGRRGPEADQTDRSRKLLDCCWPESRRVHGTRGRWRAFLRGRLAPGAAPCRRYEARRGAQAPIDVLG